jgi:hypothetical protein
MDCHASVFSINRFNKGSAIAQAVGRQLPKAAGRVRAQARSCHVRSVVDKVALGQVFSEFFGFPCQLSFHRLLHIHHHLSSGDGTIGQLVADVPSGLSLTPPQETTKKKAKPTLFRKAIPQSLSDVLRLKGILNPSTASFSASLLL